LSIFNIGTAETQNFASAAFSRGLSLLFFGNYCFFFLTDGYNVATL